MACTLIAGKVEECYRRVRDIVNVYYWLAQRMQGQPSAKIMDYVSDVRPRPARALTPSNTTRGGIA